MPRRLIASGARPLISRPPKRTRPAVGAWMPVTTLKSVDLPAPFGPITEKTSPSRTVRLTSVSAASAPKLRETASTSRTTPSRAIA